MAADKDMTEDGLLCRLSQCREDWAEQCASTANFAFGAAKLRSAELARMPKHLRDALDGIGKALPYNPRDWTSEHKARILATELVPEHEESLLALDGLAELYAETRQALQEVRLKRREESGQ